VADPVGDLLLRYARTYGPFSSEEPAVRLGLPVARVELALGRLLDAGKVLEGAFRPGGREREWCAPEVLASVRRRSLAKLRREVEPVPPSALARTITAWQGVVDRRRGLDSVLDAVEKLQGAPLAASLLESDILPALVEGYLPGDIDALASAGEVVWTGVGSLGARDGRLGSKSVATRSPSRPWHRWTAGAARRRGRGHDVRTGAGGRDTVNQNVAPRPGSLETPIWPPCACTRPLPMKRPRPDPHSGLPGTRKNFSKRPA
jgi:ATP-dependent helicase Lhr and Lhr-like helicase